MANFAINEGLDIEPFDPYKNYCDIDNVQR